MPVSMSSNNTANTKSRVWSVCKRKCTPNTSVMPSSPQTLNCHNWPKIINTPSLPWARFAHQTARIRLYQQAIQLGFSLPDIIAPTAHVSCHATIGAGTIVMHGAIVNAGARVGKNCIINTRALVEHDAIVEDHCHISTGAILNGSVYIGAGSFVGSGCVIKDGITLGKSCVVGMGLCVRHNQADNTRFVGHDKS